MKFQFNTDEALCLGAAGLGGFGSALVLKGNDVHKWHGSPGGLPGSNGQTFTGVAALASAAALAATSMSKDMSHETKKNVLTGAGLANLGCAVFTATEAGNKTVDKKAGTIAALSSAAQAGLLLYKGMQGRKLGSGFSFDISTDQDKVLALSCLGTGVIGLSNTFSPKKAMDRMGSSIHKRNTFWTRAAGVTLLGASAITASALVASSKGDKKDLCLGLAAGWGAAGSHLLMATANGDFDKSKGNANATAQLGAAALLAWKGLEGRRVK